MNRTALLRRRRQPAVAVTPKELLVRAGRIALWMALAVVLVRGLAAILSSGPTSQRAAASTSAGAWPDDAARAFAVEFASVYLEHADGHDPAAAAQAMARFASGDLADALAPRLNGRGPRQTIGSVAVAAVERLDREHALITVAASITGAALRTLRLTVPVARGADRGLAVYDLPSLAPDPPRATVDAADTEPLAGAERDAISDVLARFFRGYLAGDTGSAGLLRPARHPGRRDRRRVRARRARVGQRRRAAGARWATRVGHGRRARPGGGCGAGAALPRRGWSIAIAGMWPTSTGV